MRILIVLMAVFGVVFSDRTLDLSNIFGYLAKVPIKTKVDYRDKNPEFQTLSELLEEDVPTLVQAVEQYGANISDQLMKDKSGDVVNTCYNDTMFLLTELRSNASSLDPSVHAYVKQQALRYIDSTSKIPTSIMSGNWMWSSDYDECHAIDKTQNIAAKSLFGPRYFSVAIHNSSGQPLYGTQPIVTGVCLPDTCNKGLLNTAIYVLKTSVKQLRKLDINATVIYEEQPETYEASAKAFLAITGILCVLMLIGTIVDYFFAKLEPSEPRYKVEDYEEPYPEQSDRAGLLSNELFSNAIQHNRFSIHCVDGKLLEFCRAFSLYSNGKKLFSTKTANGPLACLNAIRVLSMWWVILGHNYLFVSNFIRNPYIAYKMVTRFTFQPILNGTFSVDSFFFLSGLLVAYLAFKELKEKGSLNWFYYIIHRYWRLTPLYAFVIFYFTYMMKYTTSVPMKFNLGTVKGTESLGQCEKYWWTNLLYINNFYPDNGNMNTMCLDWGWYLANDMQFYLILAPLIILLTCFNKKCGIVTAVVLILACIATRIGIIEYYGIRDFLQQTPTKHTDDSFAVNGPMYQRPYTRWSVYVVGLLTGYVLAMKSLRIRIHRLLALVVWCAAIASGLAVIYGLYHYYHNLTFTNTQIHITMPESVLVFYGGLSRTVWGLCLAWVVLACVSGNGSFIKDILSWKVWAPLGRLTYAAYLVHPIVIYTYGLSLPETFMFSELTIIYLFVGNLVLSYVIAFCVSMLVEAPMIQLEKLVLVPFGRKMVPFYYNIGNKLRRRKQDEE